MAMRATKRGHKSRHECRLGTHECVRHTAAGGSCEGVGMLRILLPILFCPALIAAPVLEVQPRPVLPAWSADAPADPARDAVLAACGALSDSRSIVPRNCWFTVSETSVIRGLILRKGGPFDSTPPPTDWNDAFPFAMAGCGAVALGFVWRGRASASRPAPGRRR